MYRVLVDGKPVLATYVEATAREKYRNLGDGVVCLTEIAWMDRTEKVLAEKGKENG